MLIYFFQNCLRRCSRIFLPRFMLQIAALYTFYKLPYQPFWQLDRRNASRKIVYCKGLVQKCAVQWEIVGIQRGRLLTGIVLVGRLGENDKCLAMNRLLQPLPLYYPNWTICTNYPNTTSDSMGNIAHRRQLIQTHILGITAPNKRRKKLCVLKTVSSLLLA